MKEVRRALIIMEVQTMPARIVIVITAVQIVAETYRKRINENGVST
jgi:hypothetical protein